jgi:V/A-type H+-transporting ATPase subunit D
MEIKVSPTRMMLVKLRRRLVIARRGHRLLKDKLEGLMQEFMPLVAEYGKLRARVDAELPAVLARFVLAGASSGDRQVEAALEESRVTAGVSCGSRLVMNVTVPVVSFTGFAVESSYSTVTTGSDFDAACEALRAIFPLLANLAELEEAVLRMAAEIEKTRRRVNALEYILIPSLASTTKQISSKLDEAERGSRARLMKIKDLLRTAAQA